MFDSLINHKIICQKSESNSRSAFHRHGVARISELVHSMQARTSEPSDARARLQETSRQEYRHFFASVVNSFLKGSCQHIM